MSILTILLCVFFFLIIISFGYIITRNLLGESNIIVIIPCSVCIGCSVYATLLHFSSLIIGLRYSVFFILFLIIFVTIIYLLKSSSKENLSLEIAKNQFYILSACSLFLTLLSTLYLKYFDTYDPLYDNIGIISTQELYPPNHPYNPELKASYHFGAILLASALKIFSKIDAWNSLLPIQIIFIFILPFLIFSFVYKLSKSFSQAFCGTIIGILSANLTSFKLITFLFDNDKISFLKNLHENVIWMADDGFASSVHKALISPNMSVAFPLSIILLYLCIRNKIQIKKILIPVFFISCFLFYTYEAFWLPVITSVSLYFLYNLIKNKFAFSTVKATIPIVLIFIITPLIMGGVLSNNYLQSTLAFEPKLYTYSWSGLLGKVYPNEWFEKNLIVSDIDSANFYKVNLFSKYFLVEFGLPLLFLPIIILWLYTKVISNRSQLFCFLISGFIAFLVPFLITYVLRESNLSRFFIYSRFVFSTLFGMFLGYLFTLNFPGNFTLVHRFCLIIVIFITTIPSIIWYIPKKYADYDYRYNKISMIHKKALKWLSHNVKNLDRGLGPTNIPYQNFILINLAGVYSVTGDKYSTYHPETIKTAFSTLNPCLLKDLKVKWLYLNKDLLSLVPHDKLHLLEKEKILQLKYETKNKAEEIKIYKFNPKDFTSFYNSEYKWTIGKMQKGKFIPLKKKISMSTLSFSEKVKAEKYLDILKNNPSNKNKRHLYKIEAIKT